MSLYIRSERSTQMKDIAETMAAIKVRYSYPIDKQILRRLARAEMEAAHWKWRAENPCSWPAENERL
jgi:hypothetical protein